MGRRCSAIGCTSIDGDFGVFLHRFPLNDPPRLKEWLKLCPPDLPLLKRRHCLCSKHFRRSQYLNFSAKAPRLVHNAVPFQNISPINSPNTTVISQVDYILPHSLANEEQDPRLGFKEILGEHKTNGSEPKSEDHVTVSVNMKDIAEDLNSTGTTRASLILENISLKIQNQELKMKLEECQKKLAMQQKEYSMKDE